ncbi:unnamed protein product [Linum tenue]|uniref:Uncharacterized protein n=1 Tax=Linum tenue TaxID=586396 RepID=A0AAV0I6Y6_9ROSI|nr:unnamed protein product [Linum tenue]
MSWSHLLHHDHPGHPSTRLHLAGWPGRADQCWWLHPAGAWPPPEAVPQERCGSTLGGTCSYTTLITTMRVQLKEGPST